MSTAQASAAAYEGWADDHPDRPVLGALMRFDARLIRLLVDHPGDAGSISAKPDYRLITELEHGLGIEGHETDCRRCDPPRMPGHGTTRNAKMPSTKS